MQARTARAEATPPPLTTPPLPGTDPDLLHLVAGEFVIDDITVHVPKADPPTVYGLTTRSAGGPFRPDTYAYLEQDQPATGNRGWVIWICEYQWMQDTIAPENSGWRWNPNLRPTTRITKGGRTRPPQHQQRLAALATLGFEPVDPDQPWDWDETGTPEIAREMPEYRPDLYATLRVRRIGGVR